MQPPLAGLIKDRVRTAARALGAADPVAYVGPLLDRSFELPSGDPRYTRNTLTPGTAPFEPSFSEREPGVLRFTVQPLGPDTSPPVRRDEATRVARSLVGPSFGRDALRWFDERSEDWRGFNNHARLHFGAWFGSGYDHDGLASAKVYYELLPNQIDSLPPRLAALARAAQSAIPGLLPLFTTIACRRSAGSQRATFAIGAPLRLIDLQPLMERLGMAHQLPSLMQIAGLVLGGRFELPPYTALLGVADTPEGPELRLEALLGLLDVQAFPYLLALGLAERPAQLRALNRWLAAFMPAGKEDPGHFSVLSIRTTQREPARVGLYLRPAEFEADE